MKKDFIPREEYKLLYNEFNFAKIRLDSLEMYHKDTEAKMSQLSSVLISKADLVEHERGVEALNSKLGKINTLLPKLGKASALGFMVQVLRS